MTTNGKLTWENCRVKLGDLKPWTQNPRMSTKAQAKRILQSLDDFGQVQTVAIGPDSTVYDGHQRLSALLTVHGPDYEIDARRSSRELSDVEHRALVIALHAGAMGAWDWNGLSGWDAQQLGAWGMDGELLKTWNDDAGNLREMIGAELAEPSGDEWADAFDSKSNSHRSDGLKQVTFVIQENEYTRLISYLSGLDKSKNVAIVKWLEISLSGQ